MNRKYDYPRIKQIMPCESNLWAMCRGLGKYNLDAPGKDWIYYEKVIGWALMEDIDPNEIPGTIHSFVNPLLLDCEGTTHALDCAIEGYLISPCDLSTRSQLIE
jgi:hypothetical protein